ncbi:MAG: BA14K family protein [Pseudomonadota bacterium]
MLFVNKSLAIVALCFGALVMVVPQADAGKKNRYKSYGGVKYHNNIHSGKHFTRRHGHGRNAYHRNYNRHSYKRGYGRHIQKRGYALRGCYGAYCRYPYRYGKRGYYPRGVYGPNIYLRFYGQQRYYRPYPSIRTSYSRAHFNYCRKRYRSYRAADNTFQPYHGPRKACRSPY